MKSHPRYTVDHEVRFASNRDGVELAASVFLPADWSATLPEKGKGNNDASERSETTRGAEATSSRGSRELKINSPSRTSWSLSLAPLPAGVTGAMLWPLASSRLTTGARR